jgi:putative ABC transport system permease protein
MMTHRSDAEFVLGDLEELRVWRAAREGSAAADRRYVRDAISLAARRLRRSVPAAAASPGSRRRPGMLKEFAAEVMAAIRSMLRHPGFSLMAMVTLALGIGSAAAVFGMANQLILRPLPGTTRGASYLQLRSAKDPGNRQGRGLSLPDVQELRRAATLLDGIGSYGLVSLRVAVDPASRPLAIEGSEVWGDYFRVLGARPAAGRLIRAEETEPGADPLVAVIGEELRDRLFGSGGEVVGRTLYVNGKPFVVIGVAGGGFQGPQRGDGLQIWLPLPALLVVSNFTKDHLVSRNSVMHNDLVIRPRPGVEPAAVEAQIADVLGRLAEEHPEDREYLTNLRPVLFPGLHIRPMLRDSMYGSLRLLGGIAALVLLIACANVANLLLFRNVTRRGSVATRRALGASTGRIARQHLAESMVIGMGGAVIGLAATWLIILPFRGASLLRLPLFEGFALDWRVLAFTAGAAVATAALSGTLPAALAARFDLAEALHEGGDRETRRFAGLRRFMSGAQIALSITLLVAGLLLTRTIRNLYSAETGFDVTNVGTLFLDRNGWEEGAAAQDVERRLLAAVQQVPGIEMAALDLYGPHGPQMSGRIQAAPADTALVTQWPVTPGWFELFHVRMLHGHGFTSADWQAGGRMHVVVTASLARRLFGSTDVVGRILMTGMTRQLDEAEIIGVTDELRSAYTLDQQQEAVFVPFDRFIALPFASLLYRTRDANPRTNEDVRDAVASVLPANPIPDGQMLSERVDRIFADRRLFSRMLSLLSALGAALAAIGLYGVIAFAVAGRVREFGIRLAIGADSRRIARLVLSDASRIVGFGIMAGLAGAWALSSLLKSRLFGVDRLDPLSWAGAVVLLAFVALAASWLPIRAAMRVDPIETLRSR